MGVVALVGLECRFGEEAGQFVIEETLHQASYIAQRCVSESSLDPLQVQRAALDFLPDQIERGLGFAVAGCIDNGDFFFAC